MISFALSNQKCCPQLRFWSMLELFFGLQVTNKILENLYENIHGRGNMIQLGNSVHAMLVNGSIRLKPLRTLYEEIPVLNDYEGHHWLSVQYL